jgi:2-phosphosulfolactate phosphatase
MRKKIRRSEAGRKKEGVRAMNIRILHGIQGAAQAQGLCVVIDVFRAFSLECYLAQQGAAEIDPVGSLERAFQLKREHPQAVLIGERGGARVEGCDYGNSPSSFRGADLTGKMVIHTTSAGTQGIANAVHAQEILTGALVNAAAVADYIRASRATEVSLISMGLAGLEPTAEDDLCAEYIRSRILGQPLTGMPERIADLARTDGAKFFDPQKQSIFPQADFEMCTRLDLFPFVLRVHAVEDYYRTERINLCKQ